MKTCGKCKKQKPEERFSKQRGGLRSACKECQSEYARIRRLDSPSYQTSMRKAALKKYGLTSEQYGQLVKQQEHKCKICGADEIDTPRQRLFVDHCHATGVVRGLLCSFCNSVLGMAKDSPEVLERAAAYLRKSI